MFILVRTLRQHIFFSQCELFYFHVAIFGQHLHIVHIILCWYDIQQLRWKKISTNKDMVFSGELLVHLSFSYSHFIISHFFRFKAKWRQNNINYSKPMMLRTAYIFKTQQRLFFIRTFDVNKFCMQFVVCLLWQSGTPGIVNELQVTTLRLNYLFHI